MAWWQCLHHHGMPHPLHLRPRTAPLLAPVSPLQALAERQAIEEFIAAGRALLALRAGNVEEIGRAGIEAKALVDKLEDMVQVGGGSHAGGLV